MGGLPNGSAWTDHEDRLTAEWLQRNGILVDVHTPAKLRRRLQRIVPFIRFAVIWDRFAGTASSGSTVGHQPIWVLRTPRMCARLERAG